MPRKNTKKLNKYQRKLILDMLIGDGALTSNGRLRMKHSINQEEYVKWKESLLNNSGINTHISYSIAKAFGKEYPEIRLSAEATIASKHFRHFLYKPTKFIYHRSLFKHLDNLSIAIWYLDDGSYCKCKNGKFNPSIRIYTYVPEDTNKVIQNFFKEKYSIDFIIQYKPKSELEKHKNYNPNLTFLSTYNKNDIERFLDIVRPYAEGINCMQYKVNNRIFLADCITNNLNTKDDAVMLNPEVGDTYTE